jgi:hypothetical protein
LADSRIVLRTDREGRFSGVLPSGEDVAVATFSKDGYGRYTISASLDRDYVLRQHFRWDRVVGLPYEEKDKLDRDVRELLASENWLTDENLLGVVFKYQRDLRPALRRLIRDPHVGAAARDWLELLDDPSDKDLFAKGRPYVPDRKVEADDLVEAFQATARLRNFNSSRPEPMFDIDLIALTTDLDCALIQCGINRVAMTGITWQFVFRKVGKQWSLCSAKEAARS